jgi:aldose 1-epimerase
MSISKQYLTTIDEGDVFLYTLTNLLGMQMNVLNYGGIITELHAPDRHGNFDDVVLGFKTFEEYLQPHPYFGTLVGRVAGRLTGARYQDRGHKIQLLANDGPNHLHGGAKGIDKRLWQGNVVQNGEHETLELELKSPDGDQGYPGNLTIKVTYSLTSNHAVKIDYHAQCDQKTPLSLTQHSYFNLAGESSGSILDHQIQINADYFTSGNEIMTLSGELEDVSNQANDFRISKTLRSALSGIHKQHGDLYWVNQKQKTFSKVAQVYEPNKGRQLDVYTSLPCLQFYSGRYLSDQWIGKSGNAYQDLSGLCLECQKYPDPDGIEGRGANWLNPHEKYRETTVYQFSSRSA